MPGITSIRANTRTLGAQIASRQHAPHNPLKSGIRREWDLFRARGRSPSRCASTPAAFDFSSADRRRSRPYAARPDGEPCQQRQTPRDDRGRRGHGSNLQRLRAQGDAVANAYLVAFGEGRTPPAGADVVVVENAGPPFAPETFEPPVPYDWSTLTPAEYPAAPEAGGPRLLAIS
jgi:hypothetical protein